MLWKEKLLKLKIKHNSPTGAQLSGGGKGPPSLIKGGTRSSHYFAI